MRSAFWPNAFHLPVATESTGKECCAGWAGQGELVKLSFHQRCWGEAGKQEWCALLRFISIQ